MKKLDLHGTRHDEAPRELEHFLYNSMTAGDEEVEIVTGNSPTMKEIVSKVAKDHKMEAKEVWGNFGVLRIKLK